MKPLVQYQPIRSGESIRRSIPIHLGNSLPEPFESEPSVYVNSPSVGLYQVAWGYANRMGGCHDALGRWLPWNAGALPAGSTENGRAWNPLVWMRPKTRVGGVVATLTHPRQRGYFHWLFDVLPRYALLEESGDSTHRLYLDRSQAFQRQTLDLLDIGALIVDATQVAALRAETLLVPGAPSVSGVMPPWVCAWLRSRLGGRVPAAQMHSRRIYVSRSVVGRGTVANESALRARLEARGFETVHSERLSIAEQIAMFQNTEIVVGPHGAGLSNVVFAPAGCCLVELFSESYVNVCYWTLCCQLGLSYAFLTAKPCVGPGGAMRSDLQVDLEQLDRLLDLVELTKAGDHAF